MEWAVVDGVVVAGLVSDAVGCVVVWVRGVWGAVEGGRWDGEGGVEVDVW